MRCHAEAAIDRCDAYAALALGFADGTIVQPELVRPALGKAYERTFKRRELQCIQARWIDGRACKRGCGVRGG